MAGATSEGRSIISADGLTKVFHSGRQGIFAKLLGGKSTRTVAVDHVDFDIREHDIVGLVGESGCGKTTTAKLIAGSHRPTGGTIRYKGTEIGEMDDEEFHQYRKECQMIFQDPFQAINPTFSVRTYLTEPLRAHGVPSSEWEEIIEEALIGLNLPPAEYLDKQAHELSGGERQRVHIASALVLDPAVLICDEPASMLDVSIRSSLLSQIKAIARERGVTIVFISHDLSITRYLCDEIFVMYRGKIVEKGAADRIVDDPKHPYTQTLVSAIPVVDPAADRDRIDLPDIEEADDLGREGCIFAHRCPEVMDVCRSEVPELAEREGTERPVACHLYEPKA